MPSEITLTIILLYLTCGMKKSLSSNELSSIIANEEQNHAIGILLIYPENYLTQQEKHYDYNNVLAITARCKLPFSLCSL